jgi:hypothetical protein
MGLDQGGENELARKYRFGGQFPILISIFFKKQGPGKQGDRQKDDQYVNHGSVTCGRLEMIEYFRLNNEYLRNHRFNYC